MLQVEKSQLIPVGEQSPASASLGESIDFVFGFLRRRYLSMLICLVLSLVVGAAYFLVTPPSYTATAVMMLETRKNPVLQATAGDGQPDPAWIESQIGVLKSQNVAAYLVKQLRLADDPGFAISNAGLFGKLLDRLDRLGNRFGLRTPAPQTEAERMGQAIATFSKQLEIRRIAPSYLVNIHFRSHNPEQAVKIANALIDAYVFDQLSAKYQANRRASDWLQERLQALREQAAAAERAVVEFKAKNNIVAAGGTLMSDQQLTDLNSRLVAARAHTSDVQARLQRIDEILQSDQPSTVDESVSEALSNTIITKLRGQYLELVNREADWSVRYGKNHNAVVTLRRQIQESRKSILNELSRIRETTKSDLEIAKKRQEEVENRLSGLVSQSQETSQAQVALFSLEAAAQSYRKQYDSFLQRHTETVQQQSFPIIEARSVSSASAVKTHPNPLMISIISVFAGGVLGAGLGFAREILDRGFRTREQVQSILETECLALVPALTNRGFRPLFVGQSSIAAAESETGRAQIMSYARTSDRTVCSAANVLRPIFDSPSSPYGEAIRSIKLTIDLSDKPTSPKVIGLTSCLSSEGKSTIAASLAGLVAKSGGRVILIDADLRNPSLSRALAPEARAGLLEAIAGGLPLEQVVWTEPVTGMAFLPAIENPHWPNPGELLTSSAAKSLFIALQLTYDYVIVDLPPLTAGVDVRAASVLIDSYVLVIEWGATKMDAVRYALRNTPGIQENILGAVLNKVDIDRMSRYDSYGATYYHVRSGDGERWN